MYAYFRGDLLFFGGLLYMSESITGSAMENICLKHDNGPDIQFCGRLFAESSWYDEEYAVLTRQKLYVTDKQEQVYYIVRGGAQTRNRSAYRLSVMGDHCIIHNGNTEMVLPFDMLMLVVRELCGLDANATPSLYAVEEMLKAANA